MPRPAAFHVITKPTGPLCNLGCQYCFYLEKENLYPDIRKWSMSDEILESFIRQYIESQDIPSLSFAWQGGEPTLLGTGFFRKVADLQEKYADGKKIENCFQTNGVLLDDEWGEFLAEHGFLVGLSIDGPREFHDRFRVDKGGAPTFDRVMKGREALVRNGVEFNTLTCVQKHNADHPLEIYSFLKEIGQGFMQFIPIVERKLSHPGEGELTLIASEHEAEANVTGWSVGPLQYGKFLTAIFDEWVRGDVSEFFVQIFDVSLESWYRGAASLCVFQETCGLALALEHNGDLYSCDHYVYPQNRLGNIMQEPLAELVDSEFQRHFGMRKKEALPAYCLKCRFLAACRGECPKHRFLRTPDGEPGLNYLCKGYKHYFSHVAPYMEFMAEELGRGQAPANVMKWVHDQEEKKAGKRRPGRNDPCPCGSGKKFKKCCGAGDSAQI